SASAPPVGAVGATSSASLIIRRLDRLRVRLRRRASFIAPLLGDRTVYVRRMLVPLDSKLSTVFATDARLFGIRESILHFVDSFFYAGEIWAYAHPSPGKFGCAHNLVFERLVGIHALHSGSRLVTADRLRRTTVDALRDWRGLLQPWVRP